MMTTEQLTIEQAYNIVFAVIGQAELGNLSEHDDNNKEIARYLKAEWKVRTTDKATARNGACDTAALAMRIAKQFAGKTPRK